MPKHTDGHKHSTLSYLIISINDVSLRHFVEQLSCNIEATHFANISIMEVARMTLLLDANLKGP
jgi:hypothetical protein